MNYTTASLEGMAAAPTPLAQLYAEHAASIAALRAELGADLPQLYDDLYLLRYTLSYPSAPERTAALRKGIAWRAAHAELLADAAAGRPPPAAQAISSSQVAAFHGATRGGDPLFVVRSGLCSPVELMKIVSVPDFTGWLMYYREVGFLMCDKETRARGHLVKQITVVDLKDSPLSVFDRPYFSALGEASTISEYVYPQLLRRSVLMHPPSFFSTVFAFIRPFMSAKSLEKTTLCPGATAARPAFAACPFAAALFDGAALPTFLGGTCRCTPLGGCICGRPNEQCLPGTAPKDAVFAIPARAVHDVYLTACVFRFCVVVFQRSGRWGDGGCVLARRPLSPPPPPPPFFPPTPPPPSFCAHWRLQPRGGA
jgi:hypothetical protein